MNELALFAGAGGGILGGKLLGWRTVCAVERDAYAAQVLAQRQNDGCLEPFPVWSDVQSFEGTAWRGIVDVVSGGFPCQDISCAGKGAGLNGERSGLWAEMARIIGEVEPKHAFIENSPMLVTRGLATVLSDLDAMGFDAEWGCIGASAVGAPHKRERLWIVATHPERVQEREEPCCREVGRMGREFKSLAWDRDWKDAYASLRGMGNGLARAVDRTDAIRNGQVPAVAAAAWRLLTANAVLREPTFKENTMYPPFTMSKYATKEQLYKDKASYYEQLAKTLAANADNDKLSDADFRQVVRNSIPEFKAANDQAHRGGAA